MAKKREEDLSQKGMESLQAIAQVVSHSLDLVPILKEMADKVLEFMDVKNLGLFIYEETTDTLNLIVHRGLGEKIIKEISSLRMGEDLTGFAALQKKIVTTDSVTEDSRSHRVFKEEGKQKGGCYIPLMSKGRLFGVLSLTYHEIHPFDPQEIQFLEIIGNLIGQMIENARLYDGVKKYNSELEKIVEAKTHELFQRNEELKQAYEDLKIAQERLVKASRLATIGEMGLTSRHEINNPLAAILGEVQLLLMEKDLSQKMEKGLRTIEQMSVRIRDIVRRLSEVKENRTKEFPEEQKTIDPGEEPKVPTGGKERR